MKSIINNTMSSVSSIKDLRLVPCFKLKDNIIILPPVKYTGSNNVELHWTMYIELLTLDDHPLTILDEYYNGKIIDNAKALTYTEFGRVKTKQGPGVISKTEPTVITTGLNIGNINQTNVFTQGLKNAISSYNKHIKDKKTESIAITEENISNKLFGEVTPLDFTKTITKSNRGPKPKKDKKTSVLANVDDSEEEVTIPVIEGTYFPPMLLHKHSIVELPQTENVSVKDIDFTKLETLVKDVKNTIKFLQIFKKIEFINEHIYLQPKLDGLRCVALFTDNTITLYTRKLTIIPGHVHMKMQMMSMYRYYSSIKLENGEIIDFSKVYLDGELYHHKIPLNEINSIVKNTNNTNEIDDKLEFHIFDCFIPSMINLSFKYRQEILRNINPSLFASTGVNKQLIKIVPTIEIKNNNALAYYTTIIIKHGYEGCVVKYGEGPYEFGYGNKRSKYNLKIKQRFDSEYKIVGFTKGNKGSNAGAIIWIMETENGDTFKATPKYDEGTEDVLGIRKKLYEELTKDPAKFEAEYKGKYATIEYEDISDKGIPQRVKFIGIREDLP